MAQRRTLDEALEPDEEVQATTRRTAAPQPKPDDSGAVVKLTIEVTPAQHLKLKSFALLQAGDASLANIVRAAINVMDDNPKFGKAIADEAARMKAERRASR
jgi:hypothetical protein